MTTSLAPAVSPWSSPASPWSAGVRTPLLSAAAQLDALGFRAFARRLRTEPEHAGAVILDFLSPPPEMARAIGALPAVQAGNAVLRPLLSLVGTPGARSSERSTWYTPSGPENTVAV
jgi:hypothetical protein